jgi:hypothetical protein
MEMFWLRQVMLDKLTQPGYGDAVDHFHGRGRKYGTSKLMVPAVI